MLTRDEAWSLLTEYNQEPFHLQHAKTVEGVMRWYANELGYGGEADFGRRLVCSTIWILSSIPRSTAGRPRKSCGSAAWMSA